MSVNLTSRRAFTLIELLMVIVLSTIVMAALTKMIVGQQRFYRGAADMVETQSNVRDAVDLLASELRGISPANGDIFGPLSSTAIDFLAPVGATVVCQSLPAVKKIVIPPVQLAANNGLSSWVTPPKTGDVVLLYGLGSTELVSDNHWQATSLNQNPTPNATCTTAGLTTTVAEQSKGWTLQLVDAPGTDVPNGSAIRILRHVHYELYQAGDDNWYLGYYECTASGTCSSIQPVSGPYLPAATSGQSGLTLAYFDNTGAVTTTPTAVARIDITTRAQPRNDILDGSHVDSLSTTVMVRN